MDMFGPISISRCGPPVLWHTLSLNILVWALWIKLQLVHVGFHFQKRRKTGIVFKFGSGEDNIWNQSLLLWSPLPFLGVLLSSVPLTVTCQCNALPTIPIFAYSLPHMLPTVSFLFPSLPSLLLWTGLKGGSVTSVPSQTSWVAGRWFCEGVR